MFPSNVVPLPLLAFNYISMCNSDLVFNTVTHDHEEGNVVFNWKRNRLFNHTACLVLYHMCMEVRKLVNRCMIYYWPNISCILLVRGV